MKNYTHMKHDVFNFDVTINVYMIDCKIYSILSSKDKINLLEIYIYIKRVFRYT
jgi:hypothetical protein